MDPMTLTLARNAVGGGLSMMAKAVSALYQAGTDLNSFLDRHIADMKASENETISRTGRVIEAAKAGFGIGYISSVAIIATGQFLLGNTLSAAATVASAVTISNPIAMTCAAFGAIYYGWNALSDDERNEILEKVSKGLEIGIELIKSVISFVIDSSKKLFSKENLAQIKKDAKEIAKKLGKGWGQITRKIPDILADGRDKAKEEMERLKKGADKVLEKTKERAGKVGDVLGDVADKAGEVIDRTKSFSTDTLEAAKIKMEKLGEDLKPSKSDMPMMTTVPLREHTRVDASGSPKSSDS